MPSSSEFERQRHRLERLLQVVAADYDLRVEFGDQDGRAEGTVVIGSGTSLPEHSTLLGRGLHQVAHLLDATEGAFEEALAEERLARRGFADWWHALEDARAANRLVERYPASGALLDRAAHDALAGSDPRRLPATRQVSLALYLWGRGRRSLPVQPAVEAIVSEGAFVIERAAVAASPSATLEAARALYPLLASLSDGHPSAGTGGVQHRRAVALPEPARATGEPGDGEGSEETAVEAARAATVGGTLPWFDFGAGRKTVHPAAVVPDRTTIEVPEPGDPERFARLHEAVRAASGGATERLMRLVGDRARVRWRGGHRHGRIDGSRLWRHRLGDEMLFRRPDADCGEPAVSILLDESASTARASVSEMVAGAGVFAGEVLDRLGISFEIIGYTTECFEAEAAMRLGLPPHEQQTTRCSLLRHRLHKSFDEPFRMVRFRLATVAPRHNNWDEEHLLFAARRLAGRRETRRMILVVGDGQPNGEAALLRDTVARLEGQGTMVAAIGVGYDYVARVYPRHRLATDLPSVLQGIAELISEAAGATRPAQAVAV
ncbi:MAG: hypothetical protein HYU54_05785 [Actinobacteria bacterium]|nr:hypothetical protein [Actinomycetota bacterium]